MSCGAKRDIDGEVVFNTGMVGYPESLTDPSYKGQILVFTYPLIGNYGIPDKDLWESEKIQASGVIVSQAEVSFSAWLEKQNIPALCDIDTRTLTKIIRVAGVMKGKILHKKPNDKRLFLTPDENINFVSQVSRTKPAVFGSGMINIMLIDCGVKENIIRSLVSLGVRVTVVPWNYNFKNSKFDGIVISNGPGDPKTINETIKNVKIAVSQKVPILGICLGNQILALAAGADTYKLKYGHRGQNQPVKDLTTEKCFITSQNHGYAVSDKTLPSGWMPWFINLNDQTNEGIRHMFLPQLGVQFHPEANPGPTDTSWIFSYFISEVEKWKKRN